MRTRCAASCGETVPSDVLSRNAHRDAPEGRSLQASEAGRHVALVLCFNTGRHGSHRARRRHRCCTDRLIVTVARHLTLPFQALLPHYSEGAVWTGAHQCDLGLQNHIGQVIVDALKCKFIEI